MSKKEKKDIFKLSLESNSEIDLISKKFGEMESLIQKQVAISNRHLKLFEDTLSSLSNDYNEIQKIKRKVFFLSWILFGIGLVLFLSIGSYFIYHL
jgi:hypothetical protein